MTNSLEALIASMKAAAKTLNGAYPEAINKPPKALLIDYINATNPDNVLSLIAALEQARKENQKQIETIASVTERSRIAELVARELSVKLPDFTLYQCDDCGGVVVDEHETSCHCCGDKGTWTTIPVVRAAGGTVEGSE
jgi:rubrerythrin